MRRKVKKRYKVTLIILILLTLILPSSAAAWIHYNGEADHIQQYLYDSWTLPVLYISCEPSNFNCIEPKTIYSGNATFKMYSHGNGNPNSRCWIEATDDIGYYYNEDVYSDRYFWWNYSYRNEDCLNMRRNFLIGYQTKVDNWYRNEKLGRFIQEIPIYKTWVTIQYLRKRPFKFFRPPECVYIIIKGEKLEGESYKIDSIKGDIYDIEEKDLEFVIDDLKDIPSISQVEFDKLPTSSIGKWQYDQVFWAAQWVHPNCRNWVPFKDKNNPVFKSYY